MTDINTNQDISDFVKQYGFDAVKDLGVDIREYPHYKVLNYGIKSPKHHAIVDQCRALIVDNYGDVLCRSFDRFYNWGEDQKSNEFDISRAIVQEKLDGSIIMCWHNKYLHRWNVSTRSMAHAEGETNIGNSFYSIVERACRGQTDLAIEYLFFPLNRQYTHIFEITSPENRIVTPYSEYKLTYLASRCTVSGEYSYFTGYFKDVGINIPKEYSFSTVDDCIKAAKELPTLEEGYVAKIGDWRIKIKNPSYLAVATLRMNGAISPRRIARLVFAEDEEEYLQYFPEDRQFFQKYVDAYVELKAQLAQAQFNFSNIEDQKEFAVTIKDLPYKHFLFALRAGKNYVSVVDKMTDESKLNLLERMLEHG